MRPPPISDRAATLVAGALAPYIAEHIARSGTTNQAGLEYIGLGVAENKQMWDLLGPKLTGPHRLDPSVSGYDDMVGSARFRERIAGLLGRHLAHRPIDPDSVITMAGAGAILEALGYALAGPGEAVLVPTPSYVGFWPDLELRSGLSIVPVHTKAADRFTLTIDLVDAAVERSRTPVRALLYTNPDNPTGRVASSRQVESLLSWCEQNGIHLIADELYGMSVFGDTEFTSVARLRNPLGPSVHLVWALSKDLAMSGFRCGVLVTDNPEVQAAMRAQAAWGSVSTHTQAVIGEMIDDPAWVDEYLTAMPRRLRTIYSALTDVLARAGVGHVPSEAGFFFLVDLRPFLDGPGWEAEERLWRRILDEANVNLTPGSACRISEPGFFRLCFAGVPPEDSNEAVRRLLLVLGLGRL